MESGIESNALRFHQGPIGGMSLTDRERVVVRSSPSPDRLQLRDEPRISTEFSLQHFVEISGLRQVSGIEIVSNSDLELEV